MDLTGNVVLPWRCAAHITHRVIAMAIFRDALGVFLLSWRARFGWSGAAAKTVIISIAHGENPGSSRVCSWSARCIIAMCKIHGKLDECTAVKAEATVASTSPGSRCDGATAVPHCRTGVLLLMVERLHARARSRQKRALRSDAGGATRADREKLEIIGVAKRPSQRHAVVSRESKEDEMRRTSMEAPWRLAERAVTPMLP